MTLRDAWEYGKKQLTVAGIAEASLDAWYLLEYVTGVSYANYFMNKEQLVSEEQLSCYQRALAERASHIPLQHITGVWEFMGLEFDVNQHVLIPRQDTEILVEESLQSLRPGMQILDMCTGSGCIMISLLKLCHYTDISGFGVDISEKALETAQKNAAKHRVCATFVQSDLFDKVTGEYDMIISNPPYIKTADICRLQDEVKMYDPYIALDGREDGLYFYRSIIRESRNYLKPNGKLLFEIGCDQAEDVSWMMKEAGFTKVMVKKDLAGLDRVVTGVYS